MGGTGNVFQTTCWIDIRRAGTSDEAQRKAIVDNLLGKYWKPVYCYLRHKGYDNERAKDLTQGFFHEIVLGNNLIQQADQTKGRFRTFLLTTLNRYVANEYRKATSQKRSPRNPLVHLEPGNLPDIPAKQAETDPEEIFNYAWASNLLDEVLSEVKDEYYSSGKPNYWDVFNMRVIEPIFEDSNPPSLAEICAKYGIEKESQVSNMIVNVKRRFRRALKRHMQLFVQSDTDTEDEFGDLLKILSSC